MGSPTQPAIVAAHDAPVGNGSPWWRKLAILRDEESSIAGGRSSWCNCGGWRPAMARAHSLGGRGVKPNRWSHRMVCTWGMSAPNGAGSETGSLDQLVITSHGALAGDGSIQWRGLKRFGGTRSQAQPVVAPHGVPVGDGSPVGAGRGTGSPTQLVVTPHGALEMHHNPQRHGLTSWGHGESSPTGGRSLRGFGGWPPSMARAHRLGWLQLTVRLKGMATPHGVGSQAWGTGSVDWLAVTTNGAPQGDGSPQWHGLTGWGDKESSRTGGRSSRCACEGCQPAMAQAHRLGGWGCSPADGRGS